MLVFSRKKDESIMIGSDIEIKIVSVGRDGVRIGISAPRSVPIHRGEVFEQIEAENRAATVFSPERLKQIKEAIQKKKG